MLATGIKTPVGIKLLGDDLETLSKVGTEIEGALDGLPGTASVYSERVVGGNYLNIRIRREDAARYGLNVADIQEVVQSAIGGMNVSETVEGLERYPINVRFPRELRNDLTTLRGVAVPTPLGHRRSRARTPGEPPGSTWISPRATSAATCSAHAAPWSSR
jgi:Cu(I)/Ag(I) efflux system membrane protein CusA/SilA